MRNLALKFIFLMGLLGFISPPNGSSYRDRAMSAWTGLYFSSMLCVITYMVNERP